MKKYFLIIAIFLIAQSKIIAQVVDDTRAKDAIQLVFLSRIYDSWGFCLPADYIVDDTTKRIVGRKFLSFLPDNKYRTIELSFKNDTIKSAVFFFNIEISWDNNKISRLTCEGLQSYDCSIIYNDKGEFTGILEDIWPNKKGRFLYTFEYNEDQLISQKNTFICNTSGTNPKLYQTITIDYRANETEIISTIYKSGKDPKPENIVSKNKTIYKIDGNLYMRTTDGQLGKTFEYTYNNLDLIDHYKETWGTKVEESSFEYIGGKLSKKETIVTHNNEFIEKKIELLIVKPDLSAEAEEYEKTLGRYGFNKQNELIYEARNGKYRSKVNGIWGEWKYFQY